ncbi:hypothetical protein Mapa_009345 [Marchantia paleacea]|nr:hypothetical protein Mapa_009345 [Marchantia paleacea]
MHSTTRLRTQKLGRDLVNPLHFSMSNDSLDEKKFDSGAASSIVLTVRWRVLWRNLHLNRTLKISVRRSPNTVCLANTSCNQLVLPKNAQAALASAFTYNTLSYNRQFG